MGAPSVDSYVWLTQQIMPLYTFSREELRSLKKRKERCKKRVLELSTAGRLRLDEDESMNLKIGVHLNVMSGPDDSVIKGKKMGRIFLTDYEQALALSWVRLSLMTQYPDTTSSLVSIDPKPELMFFPRAATLALLFVVFLACYFICRYVAASALDDLGNVDAGLDSVIGARPDNFDLRICLAVFFLVISLCFAIFTVMQVCQSCIRMRASSIAGDTEAWAAGFPEEELVHIDHFRIGDNCFTTKLGQAEDDYAETSSDEEPYNDSHSEEESSGEEEGADEHDRSP